MTLLIIGLCLFIGIHVVPAAPTLRARLAAQLGERPYKILFSVVSAIGLVVTILGYRDAPTEPVFTPSETARALLPAAMALAFVLLAVSQAPGRLRQMAQHPMLTAVLIWSAMHLLANGDLASNILFGTFAVWSTFAIISGVHRRKHPKAGRGGFVADAIAAVVGLAVFAVVLYFHADLFGVAPY